MRRNTLKLFVINLDRRPDRLARMTEILAGAGLKFDRIRAVDGAELSSDEVNRLGGDSCAPRGETACFLSHRSCWQRIVDGDIPFAAIFEDDVHFGTDVATVFRTSDWLPEDADIIKLETMRRRARIDKTPIAFVGHRTLHRLHTFHPGTAAYIVTRRGAEKLLAESQKFDTPVDHFMFNFALRGAKAFSIFQVVPAVCCQDFFLRDTQSTIGLGSDLHNERTTKLTASQKCLRELKRPLMQLFGIAQRAKCNLLGRERWMIIPFG